mmetsp:Transcript_154005/g.295316  ORF Transcript_154005/g.295316 Transcript_154005/m.295316 type:complete len:669 (-) Transcript_154005:92-2098(-)
MPVTFHLEGLDYERLSTDHALRAEVALRIRAEIADELDVDVDLVSIRLSSSSTTVRATLLMEDASLELLLPGVPTERRRDIENAVRHADGIAKAISDPSGIIALREEDDLSKSAADASRNHDVQTLRVLLSRATQELGRCRKELEEERLTVRAQLAMEENTCIELRRRLREARNDAEEAVAAAWAIRTGGEPPSALSQAPIEAFGLKISQELQSHRREVETMRRELREEGTELRAELQEVEDAAVETAEDAELRVLQIESSVRSRRGVVIAAEHAVEEESLAREQANKEYVAATQLTQEMTQRARLLRHEFQQAEDEVREAKIDTRRECGVADGLRRALGAVNFELRHAHKQPGRPLMPDEHSASGSLKFTGSTRSDIGNFSREDLENSRSAAKLRREAEDLGRQLKSWRAARTLPIAEPAPPLEPTVWDWRQQVKAAAQGSESALLELPDSPVRRQRRADKVAKKNYHRFDVTIVSAQGLRKADDIDGSDPYCICEVPGKKNIRCVTPIIGNTQAPMWDFKQELDGIEQTDSLQFSVYDKDFDKSGDDLLGRASLAYNQFSPIGFEGPLVLKEAGRGIMAVLNVRVMPLQEPRGLEQHSLATEGLSDVGISLEPPPELGNFQRVRDTAGRVARTADPLNIVSNSHIPHLKEIAPPPKPPNPPMSEQW